MRKLSKQSGAWVIKFQNVKRKYELIKQLNPLEIRNLIIEGIVTLIAMILIYFGCLFLFSKSLYPTDATTLNPIWSALGVNESIVYWVRRIFTLFMVVMTFWITNWRLSRRYRQIELRHVLSELEYIAAGNYHHRISEAIGGRLGGVVSSINKLVDSTVQAMEEERAIEQTKNQLITNVSHDIRTPLTSIIGYLSLVEDKQYETSEELREYVHIAYQKANQMKKMADDLFEYTKMTSHDMAWQFTSLRMKRFLQQLALEYDTPTQEVGIEIVVDCEEDVVIDVDVNAMVRVYDNLISNAIKYSRATQMILGAKRTIGGVVLSVKNNGIPIDESALKQLFTRFYREDTSRSSVIEGSGLGLAIVQSIVEAHQGNISVVSNEHETAFVIELKEKVYES